MQNLLHLWHSLLQAMGRDLIDFTWENNCWSYTKWENNARSLHIPRANGTMVTILQLSTSKARQTLGVWLAPDSNNEAKYAHLREEAMQWCNHMVSAKLAQPAVDFSKRQVLLPKLRYPLVATTFLEAQCQTMMQPVLQQGLPSLGVNRNFPQAVAHGPTIYHGLNLPNLHTEQLITHVITLLKFRV